MLQKLHFLEHREYLLSATYLKGSYIFYIFPYKVYLLLVQELLQASQVVMDVKT